MVKSSMQSKAKNFMLLADQPKQGKVLAYLSKEIRKIQPNAKISIVFTDYFTFFLEKSFLNGLRAAFEGEIFTQEHLYQNWQIDDNEEKIDTNFLNKWEKSHVQERGLEQLARTNQWLYGDELEQTFQKISSTWKNKILYDTIIWCEDLISKVSPNTIVSISNNTLPTNLFFEIARNRKIDFLTISHARLKNFWILRDDFVYSIGPDNFARISELYSDPKSLELANKYINEIVAKNSSAYNSVSKGYLDRYFRKKGSILKSISSDLRLLFGRIYGRIFIQPKERSIPAKRVRENLIMLTIFEIRYLVLIYLKIFGLKIWGINYVPNERYFLWALHSRPESSVLVTGDGQDEIDVLFRTVEMLPPGCFLVVKENPEMFGQRNFGFYRRLKKNKRIILVDAFAPTYEFIKKSLGVIGISGTILLEAAFFDKPSCSLGKPEFDKFLIKSGWDSASIFFDKVLLNKELGAKEKIKPYIAYLLSESLEGDLMSGDGADSTESKDLITGFAHKIINFK